MSDDDVDPTLIQEEVQDFLETAVEGRAGADTVGCPLCNSLPEMHLAAAADWLNFDALSVDPLAQGARDGKKYSGQLLAPLLPAVMSPGAEGGPSRPVHHRAAKDTGAVISISNDDVENDLFPAFLSKKHLKSAVFVPPKVIDLTGDDEHIEETHNISTAKIGSSSLKSLQTLLAEGRQSCSSTHGLQPSGTCTLLGGQKIPVHYVPALLHCHPT